MTQKELFENLCAAESYRTCDIDMDSGIGIYNEKRLHRILKSTFCQREDCFEVKVGKYIADIAIDDKIIEIQCSPLRLLRKKLEYYLEETDYTVLVVHPIIVKRTIIRAERESGEILRVRTSPKKIDEWNVLANMYSVADLFASDRISLQIMFIEAEEYRYSEAVRYRKKGKYDSELFPTKLKNSILLSGKDAYRRFLPTELNGCEFSAAEFTPYTRLRGIDVYSALNSLAALGLLKRSKQGRNVRYEMI